MDATQALEGETSRKVGESVGESAMEGTTQAESSNAGPATPSLRDQPSPPSADSFMRDPHKLIAYVIPFPQPNPPVQPTPLRFVLYTPPPPPLLKSTGEKKLVTLQRKWQEEVRAAHAEAPLLSWKGIRSRVTLGMHWAAGKTTSADLDFLVRIPRDGDAAHDHVHEKMVDDSDSEESDAEEGKSAENAVRNAKDSDAGDDSCAGMCRTVKLDSMVLLYPPNLKMTEEELRDEFIGSLMRTKSKAQRDAAIATGLLPVTAVLDWALVFVGWVFGGALEVDAIWMANSLRGAKTARSVTKRLASTSEAISLKFVPSERAEILESYLFGACIQRDAKRFNRPHWGIPSEQDVMTVIGWQASKSYEAENWEDEKWEREQVVKDLQLTMRKAAKGWDKWVDRFIKNPDKARET